MADATEEGMQYGRLLVAASRHLDSPNMSKRFAAEKVMKDLMNRRSFEPTFRILPSAGYSGEK